MIDFKKYEGTLTDLGTVASQIGAKGTIKFDPKNFNTEEKNAKGERKRVVVIVKNGDGDSAVVSCSKPLSEYLRKAKADGSTKEELLAGLLDMLVMEDEKSEVPFITMPGGEQTEGMTIADLKKVKKPAKIEALNEIAW